MRANIHRFIRIALKTKQFTKVSFGLIIIKLDKLTLMGRKKCRNISYQL